MPWHNFVALFSFQTANLEIVCKEQEQSSKKNGKLLKEKEDTILKQSQQIEKLKQIQDLITQLASWW